MTTVAIDVRPMSHPQPGGFKTHCTNLAHALARIESEFNYRLYIDRPISDPIIEQSRKTSFEILNPNSFLLVGVPYREQISVPIQAKRDNAALLFYPSNNASVYRPVPYMMQIHDTIEFLPDLVKTDYSPKRLGMRAYNRLALIMNVKKSKVITTVSENSKTDIARIFKIDPVKIFVVHNGINPRFHVIEEPTVLDGVRQQFGLEKNYIFSIGSADPRKNIYYLLEVYSRLPAELMAKHQLAILWTHKHLQAETENLLVKYGIKERVKFLQRVSDNELVQLYNAAYIFCFPSRYEGFGLPPVEAMACGTPVVASNVSSIPEAIGDAGLLASPYDVGEFSSQMINLLQDAQLHANLSQKAVKQAASFTWEKTALKTIEAFRVALQS